MSRDNGVQLTLKKIKNIEMRRKTRFIQIYYIFFLITICFNSVVSLRQYTKRDIRKFREEVREMFQHAYGGYLKYASDYDELRPISCDGMDTWGSYSLTLIDALDTLAVMGNYTEFRRVVKLLTEKKDFDKDINVSVFETNIRIVGGLLSAHLMSYRAGVELEPGWPCNGPLLRLAEDVARRLLPAFDTKTGMPYGTVNLRHGVPSGETPITCTAGVGTFIVEFGALSRLTGDPIYEEVALNAIYALWKHRSPIGLFGNHIDVQSGRWTAQDAGIGAGVDSYYEYLVKGALMLNRPDLLEMFHEGRKAIEKYLKRDDWYVWVSMNKGQVTLPVFQSLEAFWPGVLSLIGETNSAMKTLLNYHSVWRQYGFLPEFYNIPSGEAGANRESYPLRPELIESIMYLYRATRDPILLEMGVDILRSIQYSAKTPCGYATIKNVRDHRKEDRMESFFLAETTKYLYLLFDPENYLHNDGREGTIFETPNGECLIEAGGYIFNTEAHPIDPSALKCCYDLPQETDIFADFRIEDYYGEVLEKNSKKQKDNKYECTENTWRKGVDDITIDIEAEIDSNVPIGEKIYAEIVKNMEQKNVKDIKTEEIIIESEEIIAEQRGNKQFAGVWDQLEMLLSSKLDDHTGFRDLTQNDEVEIIDLIKFLLKNIKAKQFQSTLMTFQKDQSENKSATIVEKSLFEFYESRQRVKLVFEIMDELDVYQKTRSNETNKIEMGDIYDAVLKVISTVEEDEEDRLNAMHVDILKIMLRAQQRYESMFYNSVQMLTFLLESNAYGSANKEMIKTSLSNLKLSDPQKLSLLQTEMPSKLNLDYLESMKNIIAFKKKMYEAMKKFDFLTQALKAEEKAYSQHTTSKKASPENDESENLISAISKEDFLKIDHGGKKNILENNDDEILVEVEINDETHHNTKEINVGVGTVEPVDLDSTSSTDNHLLTEIKTEEDQSDSISKHIKPNPSAPNSQKIGIPLDNGNSSMFTNFVQSVFQSAFPTKPKFEPQLLLEKIRSQGEYQNYTKNYDLFTCKAQPYLHRFSILGQVY